MVVIVGGEGFLCMDTVSKDGALHCHHVGSTSAHHRLAVMMKQVMLCFL